MKNIKSFDKEKYQKLAKEWGEWGRARWEKPDQKGKETNYIIAIVVNIFLLFIFNNILNWNLPFLTRGWLRVLPILNYSIYFTIFCNSLFVFYDRLWFRQLCQFGMNIIGLWFMFLLYDTAPINFGESYIWLNSLVRTVFFLGIIAMLVAVIVVGVKLIGSILFFRVLKN